LIAVAPGQVQNTRALFAQADIQAEQLVVVGVLVGGIDFSLSYVVAPDTVVALGVDAIQGEDAVV
jgi:hypothetical protein